MIYWYVLNAHVLLVSIRSALLKSTVQKKLRIEIEKKMQSIHARFRSHRLCEEITCQTNENWNWTCPIHSKNYWGIFVWCIIFGKKMYSLELKIMFATSCNTAHWCKKNFRFDKLSPIGGIKLIWTTHILSNDIQVLWV